MVSTHHMHLERHVNVTIDSYCRHTHTGAWLVLVEHSSTVSNYRRRFKTPLSQEQYLEYCCTSMRDRPMVSQPWPPTRGSLSLLAQSKKGVATMWTSTSTTSSPKISLCLIFCAGLGAAASGATKKSATFKKCKAALVSMTMRLPAVMERLRGVLQKKPNGEATLPATSIAS